MKILLQKTKTKAWETFCADATNTYGSQYKLASCKVTKPSTLENILPDNKTVTTKETLNDFLNNLYLTEP